MMDPKAAAHLIPAFPTGHADEQVPSDGLTMRDYFAAKAMQAILAKVIDSDGSVTANGLTCATDDAYFIADEMLRARGQS